MYIANSQNHIPDNLLSQINIWNRILCLSLALLLTACEAPERKAYRTFVEDAKKSVNPEVLQEQVVALLEKHNTRTDIPVSELPAEAKKLSASPPVFTLILEWKDSKEGALMIAWGNGFAQWGVIIGRSSFKQPKPEKGEISNWIPGVDFFFR